MMRESRSQRRSIQRDSLPSDIWRSTHSENSLNFDQNLKFPMENPSTHFNVRHPVQTDVVHGVQRVSQEIQREKIEIQSHHTLPSAIGKHLRIERDGPGRKVDPSHYKTN